MERKDFVGYIALLQQEYGKPYGKNAVDLAWEKIQNCRIGAMKKALNAVMLGATMLPPLQRVIDETLRAENEAKTQEAINREEDAKREKEDYRRGAAKAFQDNSSTAKDTCDLVRAAMGGLITREKFLEGIRHLDAKFPRAGFATEGVKVQQLYEDRKLPLLDLCGGRYI